MILEGDKSVIDAIKEKKRLMDAGEEHGHIRPLLYMGGGLMKGAYGVGAAIAFEETGFTSTFTDVVGVSSGAATIAYMLSGNADCGATVTYEECCSPQFKNIFNLKNILDVKFFEEVLRGSTGKPLDAERILNHQTKIHIGVSRFIDGTPVLIEPVTPDELFLSIRASISMPGAVTLPTYIRKERYVDGVSANPHMLNYTFNHFLPTHALVISNNDEDDLTTHWYDKLANSTIFRHRIPAKLRKAANNRGKARALILRELADCHHCNSAVVWGDGSVNSYEKNSEVVKNTIEKSRQWWTKLLT